MLCLSLVSSIDCCVHDFRLLVFSLGFYILAVSMLSLAKVILVLHVISYLPAVLKIFSKILEKSAVR